MSSSNGNISTKRVAILIENDFEDSEFKVPYTALKKAGAETIILGSRMNETYKGKRGQVSVTPDGTAAEVLSEDFDAIFIPGGAAPDKIRQNVNAVRLIMDGIAQGRLIAAVCHGIQVLIEADQLRGKRATGFSSIRKDIQNAGATYIDEPVVMDGNLLTSRQPGDLALFTVTLLSSLGLRIEGMTFPETSDQTFEWWKLAEAWGGSSRYDIVNALNTALVGERYTVAAFKEYGSKVSDVQLSMVLREALTTKQRHIETLESRLAAFNEQISWQAMGSEALARLQMWLQSTQNDQDIMRRALGDIQTGLYDSTHLSGQLTDPITAKIFEEIASNLCQHEQLFAELYRDRSGQNVQPPSPTTVIAVG